MTKDAGDKTRGPVSDLEVRINILAELRGLFREAVSVCDLATLRLRAAESESERERIGEEVEGFFRRVGLGALALGSPGLGGIDNVTKEEEKE